MPPSSRLVPLAAAAVAALVIAHVLGSEPPDVESRPSAEHPSALPEKPLTPAAAARDPDAVARLAEADPDQAARLVASALPHGEQQAQALAVLEIRALVRQGKLGSARARAGDYYERWPEGPDTAVLEHLTGAHPTRSAP
jgi:hypothetical protein